MNEDLLIGITMVVIVGIVGAGATLLVWWFIEGKPKYELRKRYRKKKK